VPVPIEFRWNENFSAARPAGAARFSKFSFKSLGRWNGRRVVAGTADELVHFAAARICSRQVLSKRRAPELLRKTVLVPQPLTTLGFVRETQRHILVKRLPLNAGNRRRALVHVPRGMTWNEIENRSRKAVP
jgi:hypothetical protein